MEHGWSWLNRVIPCHTMLNIVEPSGISDFFPFCNPTCLTTMFVQFFNFGTHMIFTYFTIFYQHVLFLNHVKHCEILAYVSRNEGVPLAFPCVQYLRILISIQLASCHWMCFGVVPCIQNGCRGQAHTIADKAMQNIGRQNRASKRAIAGRL